MERISLSQKNLEHLSSRIPIPSYDREKLSSSIVHIGVGGFHRSHQAYYLHQLLKQYQEMEWGICGVGLREGDRKIAEIFQQQDSLYTLIVQHPGGEIESEIIGSIKEFIFAPESPQKVLEKLAHPETKIVSLTITEGGYNFNAATGKFNFDNPEIQQELAYPDNPKTVFGYLTAALKMRHAQGIPPFTILSCDNIQHNGEVAREMFLSFAAKQEPDLASWMEEALCFPNTMVDRITPVTTEKDVQYLEKTYAMVDQWPVVCEPFIQWVVEDNFSMGRPPLEKLGVQFVKDVSPYEKMKIRLLNAGHSVLGITGALHGHPSINACMEDAVFSSFMRKFMDEEASPTLNVLDGVDLETYKDSLEGRFSNPNIKDKVSRICSESSAKLPKFLIPTLLDNLESGGSIEYASFILAAWCYYSDKQKDEEGKPLEIIDAMENELHLAAKYTEDDPSAFLGLSEIFGELGKNERFRSSYIVHIGKIYQKKDIRSLMHQMLQG